MFVTFPFAFSWHTFFYSVECVYIKFLWHR